MVFYIIVLLVTIFLFIFFKYIKPNVFKIRMIIPFIIVFSVFAYLDISSRINDNKFYTFDFKAKIIKCKDSGKEKVVADYYLDNGFIIFSEVGKYDLEIGDSIIKLSNTYEFKVYRKNEFGTYHFIHQYRYVP